jgi:16S rRNA U516 pseudouridylate synthase RsuA-like enzyme
MRLSDFLIQRNAVMSRAEVTKLLAQRAISVNGETELGILDVEVYRGDVVIVGKNKKLSVGASSNGRP